MDVAPHALESHLKKQGLPSLVILSGDEPLLLREALDTLRQAARNAGCSEREVMRADADFQWEELRAASQSLSLFSESRLLELHLERRPDAKAREALQAYTTLDHGSDSLVIIAPQLEWRDRKAKWYQALARAGVAVVADTVQRGKLNGWLSQRAKRQGLDLDDEAVSLLAERTEGNLLAASQELEKLTLLANGRALNGPELLRIVSDQARFTALDLVDSLLRGEAAQAQHRLNHLRAGDEPLLPLQALLMTNSRQLLAAMGYHQQGQAPEQAMQSAGVFGRRQPAMRLALQRLRPPQCHRILWRLQTLEATIKGQPDPSGPWLQLGGILRLWCQPVRR